MTDEAAPSAITQAHMIDYYSRLEAKVAEHGHAIQYVLGNPETGMPAFAYTVGLSSKHISELIVVGLNQEMAVLVLNSVAEQLLAGKLRLHHHERIKEVATVDLRLDLPERQAHAVYFMRMAEIFAHQHGNHLGAIQVMLPDAKGIFPDEPGCDPRHAGLMNLAWHYEAETTKDAPRPRPNQIN